MIPQDSGTAAIGETTDGNAPANFLVLSKNQPELPRGRRGEVRTLRTCFSKSKRSAIHPWECGLNFTASIRRTCDLLMPGGLARSTSQPHRMEPRSSFSHHYLLQKSVEVPCAESDSAKPIRKLRRAWLASNSKPIASMDVDRDRSDNSSPW